MWVDSQAQTNQTKKKSAATGGKKGPTTMAFDPPVLEPEGCSEERATENSGKWLFRSFTNQEGRLLNTYWLGRNFELDPLNQQPPAPPIQNNYLGINTAMPSAVLDVHFPRNLNASSEKGISVSTGFRCSKVGLVAGDIEPSWVGSYYHDDAVGQAFQVRAGITGDGGFWNPSSGTFIHLNPQNERIGINTSTPESTLDVNGDAKVDNLKLTQVPEGLVGINGSGMISPATKSQVATLLTNGGTENHIAAFDANGGLKNSYLKQGILTSGSRSIGFKFDENLKTHFHFSKWQTLHADGGTSQFAYNSYTFWDGTNWVSEKVEPTIGASTIIQTNDGTIYFRNLKATENPATDWKTVLTMTPDRNVGIGTSNPLSKFTVKSADDHANITLVAPGDKEKGLQLTDNGVMKWKIAKEANSEDLVIGDGSLGNSVRLKKQSSGSPARFIIGSQDVSNSGGFINIKLACDGTGIFKELGVLPGANWSDYVFDKDYCLMPLDSVSSFIKTNHHLPEIPSAKEVAEKGIKLAEMNALLLKKIEELTLHLIDLKTEVDKLKGRK